MSAAPSLIGASLIPALRGLSTAGAPGDGISPEDARQHGLRALSIEGLSLEGSGGKLKPHEGPSGTGTAASLTQLGDLKPGKS